MRLTNNFRQGVYPPDGLTASLRMRDNIRMAQKPRIGHYLREWRKHRGLSMIAALEAAEAIVADRVIAEGEEGSFAKIGLSQPNLSRIERGEQPFNQTLLEVLAEVYRTDVPSLIIRNPVDPEGLWSIYDQIPEVERPTALRMLSGLKTGTNG